MNASNRIDDLLRSQSRPVANREPLSPPRHLCPVPYSQQIKNLARTHTRRLRDELSSKCQSLLSAPVIYFPP
jgi:hypothetical protein